MAQLHPNAPHDPAVEASPPLVSRLVVEIAVAAILFAIGAAVVAGGLEYKIGWDEGGPQPGYFPFYVGLVIMAGALGAGLQAWWARRPGEVFVTRAQGRQVATFFLPVVVFVLLCSVLGIYVATALYLIFTTRFLGGYPWWKALAIGIGVAVGFFVLFELLFGQPLLKGPLEGLLGFS